MQNTEPFNITILYIPRRENTKVNGGSAVARYAQAYTVEDLIHEVSSKVVLLDTPEGLQVLDSVVEKRGKHKIYCKGGNILIHVFRWNNVTHKPTYITVKELLNILD